MADKLVPRSTPRPVASPELVLSETADTKVWDTNYPPANQIDDLDVLDDWLEAVDQALTDSRNGVNSISWPFWLASLLAALALIAEAVDNVGLGALGTPAGWSALISSNPVRLFASLALVGFAAAAWKLATEGTHARKTLAQIRASYLRRRREIGGDGPNQEQA